MGEAKRRHRVTASSDVSATASSDDPDELFRSFHAAAEGVVCMHLVGVDDLSFVSAFVGADPLAVVLAGAINHTLAEMQKCKPVMVCLTCEHRFAEAGDKPLAFMIFTAGALGVPRHAIASGICLGCYRAKAPAQLYREAADRARDLWPGLRVVEIAPEHRA